MKLHELSSSTRFSSQRVNVLDAVSVAVSVKHQVAVIKVKTLVPAAAFVLDSRVDKTHCTVVYLNVDLTNRFRKEYAIVNIDDLNNFAAGTEVTPEVLDGARYC